MFDLYEYQRLPEKLARDREQGRNTCPLGKPEEYETPEDYERHKKLLEEQRCR